MRIAGRRIALLGFLLLSIGFFLPQVEGCHEPIVPARDVRNGNPILLLTLFAPFVFGFLGLVAYTVITLWRRIRIERVVAKGWCGMCAVFVAAVSVECVRELAAANSSGWATGGLATGGVFLTLGVVLLAAFRVRPFRRVGMCTLPCAACSLAFFGFWIMACSDGLRCGIWLSAGGSALIVSGALLDALAPPPKFVPSSEL